MLSEELVELMPEKEYKSFPKDNIFFGCKIKNRYDEQRININSSFNPEYYKVGDSTFLYGLAIKPTKHTPLINTIKAKKSFDLIGYSSLLEKHNLSCHNCFFFLQPPIYPIDSENITNYISNYTYENFISFSPKIPKFQQFTPTNMFLILHE